MGISGYMLSPKKEIAAGLLAQGFKQAEVARDPRVAVTKQTMNNWCKEPEFIDRINELRMDKLKQVDELFARRITDVAQVMLEIVTEKPVDDDGKPLDFRIVNARLSGAKWILDRVLGKKNVVTGKQLSDDPDPFDAGEDEIDEVLNSARK